jgi:hypothetical protein
MKSVQVRRAVPPDAAGIVNVLEAVTAERIHSAIDQVWTVEQETRYLESLAPREVFHVGTKCSWSTFVRAFLAGFLLPDAEGTLDPWPRR